MMSSLRLEINGSVDRKSEKEGSQFPSFCLKSSFGDFSRSIGASIGDIEVDVDPCVPSEACWKVFGVNCYWFHHDKNSKT